VIGSEIASTANDQQQPYLLHGRQVPVFTLSFAAAAARRRVTRPLGCVTGYTLLFWAEKRLLKELRRN